MAEVRCNGVDANFDRDLVPIQSLNVTIASSEDPPILTTGLFQDHVHLYAERAGTAKVAFSWESPAGSDSPQCTTPPIDVRVPNVETFEILDRGQDRKKIAYAHGDHWHYSDGPPEVGSGSARGSYSANVKCDGKEPDYGAGDSLHVELGNGQPEFVETESHGDHVHIRATDNGQTKVVFSWMHNDRVECSVPEMTINARMGDVNGPSPEPSPSPSPSPGPPTPSNDARTVGGGRSDMDTELGLRTDINQWNMGLCDIPSIVLRYSVATYGCGCSHLRVDPKSSASSSIESQLDCDICKCDCHYCRASVETLPVHTRFGSQRGQDARKEVGNRFQGHVCGASAIWEGSC
eukprot:scaffold270_cov347-Pavlova_lutheri.AAC.3